MTRMRVYRCVNGSVGPSLSLPFVMPCLLPYDEKHRVINKQKPLCSFLTFIIPFLDRSCQIKLHKERPFSPNQGEVMWEGGHTPDGFPFWRAFFENSRMGLVLPVGCHRFLEQAGGGRRRPGNGVSACLNGFPNEFLCGTAGSDQREIR